jgi:hypothetical protein
MPSDDFLISSKGQSGKTRGRILASFDRIDETMKKATQRSIEQINKRIDLHNQLLQRFDHLPRKRRPEQM